MSYTLYAFNNENERSEAIYAKTAIAQVITSFFSEMILCAFFFELGRKFDSSEKQNEQEQLTFTSVYTEDFDEESILQARIWNGLIRAPLF